MVAPINSAGKAKGKMSSLFTQTRMFVNCWGECILKHKWPLDCLIVLGSFGNNNMYTLTTYLWSWRASSRFAPVGSQ